MGSCLFYRSIAFATFAFRISIVAFCAGRRLQGLRVTITAGGAAVINTAPAFIGDARVRTRIFGKPVFCRMATCTIRTKHACMKDRVGMATYTGSRQASELARRMTALTSQSHMRARQRKVAAAVIEGCVVPIRGGMTACAIRAELPVVLIIPLVAGITVPRCC